MRYFKNVELSRMYKVSEKTIGNWIKNTLDKKINLELFSNGERDFILNTSHNHMIMKTLSEQGKKFKNTNAFRSVKPKDKFYQLYSDKNIIDIINSIESYQEIPHKYSYFGEGAHLWEEYVNGLHDSHNPNTLSNTVELLTKSTSVLLDKINEFDAVNLVDIGPGEGSPVVELLESLIKHKKLNKYIAIDISSSMLNLAEEKLKAKFGEEFPFIGFIRDMNSDKFEDVTFVNSHKTPDSKIVNIVCSFGGTQPNQRIPELSFHVINESLTCEDIFLYTRKLDTPKTRIYFDFGISNDTKLNEQDSLILNLLNITEDLYDVEQYYDAKLRSRLIQIILKMDIEIEFDKDPIHKKVLLRNGDKIILWRSYHQNFKELVDQLYDLNFDIINLSRTQDEEMVLVMAKINV